MRRPSRGCRAAGDPRSIARSRRRARPPPLSDRTGPVCLTGFSPRNMRRLRLAHHLDVAHRVTRSHAAREVEVVNAERLLKHGRVRLLRDREHGRAVVEHVVAADLVGAVGQAPRVLVVGRGEQQLGCVGGAAATTTTRSAVRSPGPHRARPPTSVTAVPVGLCSADRLALVSRVTFVVLERRPHAQHLGV